LRLGNSINFKNDDPIWFADRMLGLLLEPEPLCWLLGVTVSFYFGACHQSENFQIRAHEM